MRKGSVKRKTKETDVEVEIDLDGTGVSTISTGIGFFDHMLDLLARHSRIDMKVQAKGDLHIDHHHTTEDVGIALGQAVKQALGDMKGITRYASVHMPMDEALTRVAIDISGRPFLVFKAEFSRDKVGSFDTELVQEWFQAFAMNAGVTLHVETLYGTNDHHISESCFKGLARALRTAVAIDRESGGGDSRPPKEPWAVKRALADDPAGRVEKDVSMPVYTVHEPPRRNADDDMLEHAGRFSFVRDGFHFWAFLLAPFWMLRHRLWIEFILYVLIVAGTTFALRRLGIEATAGGWVALLTAILVGMEASSLRRWKLARRGYEQVGIVVGDNVEDAERRFFDGWVDLPERAVNGPAPPPPSPFGAPPPATPSTDVIGLFPQPQARS